LILQGLTPSKFCQVSDTVVGQERLVLTGIGAADVLEDIKGFIVGTPVNTLVVGCELVRGKLTKVGNIVNIGSWVSTSPSDGENVGSLVGEGSVGSSVAIVGDSVANIVGCNVGLFVRREIVGSSVDTVGSCEAVKTIGRVLVGDDVKTIRDVVGDTVVCKMVGSVVNTIGDT